MKRKNTVVLVAVVALLVGVQSYRWSARERLIHSLIGRTPSEVVRFIGKPLGRHEGSEFVEICRGLSEEGWIDQRKYPRPNGDVWIYPYGSRILEKQLFVYFDKQNKVERAYIAEF